MSSSNIISRVSIRAAGAGMVGLIVAGCATHPGGTNGAPATLSAARSAALVARDFTLRDIRGRPVRLSDHLGEGVVVLNFWATWCGPCAVELPELQRLHRAYRANGLRVIAITMDGPETMANVAPLVRRHGLEFPVLLDEETRVVGTFNPKRTAPFTVFLRPDGTIAKTREGYAPGDERAIEADVRALLAEAKR